MQTAVDILILSNGPGEVTTWVKPVVAALREQLGDDRNQVRISVVLSPDANASGQEAAIAQRFPEVDRVQGAEDFFPFLLWGKTAQNWDWRQRGVVIFLGGDQFFPVVIGKRLGYRTVVYAEWEARWHQWIDRFGVMRPAIAERTTPKYARKFSVVGDLMAEAGGKARENSTEEQKQEILIGLLPGSKAMKLSLGVPLLLAIAEQVHHHHPHTRFVIPVAPSLDLPTLAQFGNPEYNPIINRLGWASARLVEGTGASPYLETGGGLRVDLWTAFPAYELLSQCCLCLTTVGANTAELGSLAVPMVVLLPTQQMDVMRGWDGIPGLLANLPGVGSAFASLINWWVLRKSGLLAWPNIWAKEEIVPELVGRLQPEEVANQVSQYLNHPAQLTAMRDRLRQVRGEPGAAQKLAQIACDELESLEELAAARD
jgi:lipid-A-disaccharide synthase